MCLRETLVRARMNHTSKPAPRVSAWDSDARGALLPLVAASRAGGRSHVRGRCGCCRRSAIRFDACVRCSGDLDAFVKSFAATFGGQPSKPIVTNFLPVPSSTEFQSLWTPVGTLSVFAFQTPIPFPFGQERTGYLVTDMIRRSRPLVRREPK